MSKFRIFVADKLAEQGVEWLRTQDDVEVDFTTGLSPEEVKQHVAEADALIVRSATDAPADVIAAGKRLKAIGRAGIGVDNIDIDAATEHGVVVFNTPDANATTTAELAIAHMFSLSRHLPQADASVKAGEWKRSAYVGAEISGKTLGIIGYGTIGRIVANRARGLKMRVLGFDPFVTREMFAEDGVECCDLDTLLGEVDYLTLHCPKNEKTRGLINAEAIARMKPGARIINCARGGIVEEAALFQALQEKRIAGAALDVFESEPPKDSPLLGLPNVVLTPHLGASTEEAQVAVGVEIARSIVTFLRTGEVINPVNLPSVSGDNLERLHPYEALATKLGRLLGLMIEGPVKQLSVTLKGRAAELESHPVAVAAMVGLLSESMSTSSPVNRVNAMHVARRHGISLTESRTEETRRYVTLVTISATGDQGEVTLSGTLFDEQHPRLVGVNDYEIEAFLEGNLLITRHADRPGVVGALGAILGKENVNISRMQLGLSDAGDNAIAIMAISAPLSDAVLAEIGAMEAVSRVTQLAL